MQCQYEHRTGRGALAAAVALFVAMAVGCATPTLPPPVPEKVAEYRIGAPDHLSVTIFPEPVLDFEAKVRPDGRLSLPLIGEIQASGRTISDLSKEIQERMAQYKRGAEASVSLVSAESTDISVLGEVAAPGAFPLVKQTRVVEAIATVGGTTTFGWDSHIRIVRVSEGQSIVHDVDLSDIRKGDQSTNMLLEPGDIVYVPPTPWARVGYFLQAILFPFQPLLGVAKAAGGNLLVP